jgi:hypothetical protein
MRSKAFKDTRARLAHRRERRGRGFIGQRIFEFSFVELGGHALTQILVEQPIQCKEPCVRYDQIPAEPKLDRGGFGLLTLGINARAKE